MHETNDALWLAFEALAKTYPHDDGVRCIFRSWSRFSAHRERIFQRNVNTIPA